MNANVKKVMTISAGALFILGGGVYLWGYMAIVLENINMHFWFDGIRVMYALSFLVLGICCIVSAFLKQVNVGSAIALGGIGQVNLIWLINGAREINYIPDNLEAAVESFSYGEFLEGVQEFLQVIVNPITSACAAAACLAMIVVLMLELFKPENKALKFIGFIPAVFFLSTVVLLFAYNMPILAQLPEVSRIGGYYINIFGVLIGNILALLGFIALGVGVMPEKKAIEETSVAKVEKKQQRKIAEKKNDEMEKLRKYKELYDEGIITEEEFMQKKKQIMEI